MNYTNTTNDILVVQQALQIGVSGAVRARHGRKKQAVGLLRSVENVFTAWLSHFIGMRPNNRFGCIPNGMQNGVLCIFFYREIMSNGI